LIISKKKEKRMASNGSAASSSEQPEKLSKELQVFGEQFTQSIIAQFQRCLVPIESKLAQLEKNEEKLTALEQQFAQRVSKGQAFIMAAAEEYQIQRIAKCLAMQPEQMMSQAIKIGDYVTALLPNGMRKPKIQAQFRGIYFVEDIKGDNGSSIRCRCPVENTVHEIHADQLRILDLRTLQKSEEITAWAAKLLNVPEYIVTRISNHRFASTRITAEFADRDLQIRSTEP
jgi:hypothetical protein